MLKQGGAEELIFLVGQGKDDKELDFRHSTASDMPYRVLPE